MQDESPKDIIIVINDNAQDGKDISWLWDVDFDLFGGDNINSITVSGIRCQDMRLRLKCWKMMWRQPSASGSRTDAAIFMYL